MLRDMCNCFMNICGTEQDIKEYEERLLAKCFDNINNNIDIGQTQAYEPPFVDIKNNIYNY